MEEPRGTVLTYSVKACIFVLIFYGFLAHALSGEGSQTTRWLSDCFKH